ncbi:MAG TPA: roadblock/LC7 domain-containing protein [Desulfomonilaceae bacterium]|nr:roadblock/LC7 domain-containing protein [Desulfomonilaceae bacterium]
MTLANAGVEDIFKGAEKIEILGKLPSFLWAYIEAARKLTREAQTAPAKCADSADSAEKILSLLFSAANHLNNQVLKDRLGTHSDLMKGFRAGSISAGDFASALSSAVSNLEPLAGPRREVAGDAGLEKIILDRDLERAEKIKTGRSADIVVSVDILNDVRGYLTREVMTEGISSVLVIDNAGSLIVNIGDKIELDVISLAAVAAANFAATEQIARLIGERDFVLLFYKGHNESFHFSRVGKEYIIVTIFDNSLSLGLLRLKIAEVAQVLEKKLPKRED